MKNKTTSAVSLCDFVRYHIPPRIHVRRYNCLPVHFSESVDRWRKNGCKMMIVCGSFVGGRAANKYKPSITPQCLPLAATTTLE